MLSPLPVDAVGAVGARAVGALDVAASAQALQQLVEIAGLVHPP